MAMLTMFSNLLLSRSQPAYFFATGFYRHTAAVSFPAILFIEFHIIFACVHHFDILVVFFFFKKLF